MSNRTPEQLATALEDMAVNPKGGKMAAIAYRHSARLIRDHLGATTHPTTQPDAALVEAPILWCVHHRGPDDLHPVESYEAAVKMADAMNESAERFNFGHKPDSVDYVWSVSYPAIWPGTAESHGEWLEKERANAARFNVTARQDGQTEGENGNV